MVNEPTNEKNREMSTGSPPKKTAFRGVFDMAALVLVGALLVFSVVSRPHDPLRSSIDRTEAAPQPSEMEAAPSPRRNRERFSRRRRHSAESGRDVEIRAALLADEKRVDVAMRPVIVNGSVIAAPMDVEIFDMWRRSIAREAIDEDFRSVHRAQCSFSIPASVDRIKVVVTYSDDSNYTEEVDLRPERAREASDR